MDPSGLCPTRSNTTRSARAWFEKMGQINLAGQIAEARHAGRRPTRYSNITDNEQTSNYAMEICSSDEECSTWMNLLFIRARNRLDNS